MIDGFDPTTILVADDNPPVGTLRSSPITATLRHVIDAPKPSFELTNLLGYPEDTWKRKTYEQGLLWRARGTNGSRRYWIVKKQAA